MRTYRESLSAGEVIELPTLKEKKLTTQPNGTSVLRGVGDGEEEKYVVSRIPVDGDDHEIPDGSKVIGITPGVGMSGSPQAWIGIPLDEYE